MQKLTRIKSLHATLALLALSSITGFSQDVTIGGDVNPSPASSPIWNVPGDLILGQTGSGTLTLSGVGQVTASTVVLGEQLDSTGTLSLFGGSLTTGQVSRGLGTGTADFNGGTLRLSSNQANLFNGFAENAITLTGDGGTIDTQGFSVATAYELSGTGSLTKQGSGTLTLTGNHTYAGPTSVEAGALIVDGFMTGNVTVESGATFGGDGDVNGDIFLESGSTLTPIDCFDADTLTWNGGASLVFNLRDSDNDIIELTGDFNKGSVGSFAFTFLGTEMVAGQSYDLVLFDGPSNFSEGDFSFTNGGGFRGEFNLEEDRLTFQLNAVPEPSVGHLLLIAMVAAMAFARRRVFH